MYPNLKAEMGRLGIEQKDIVLALDSQPGTISLKMCEKRDWTLKETKKIRKTFFPDLTLDYLFKTQSEIEQERNITKE